MLTYSYLKKHDCKYNNKKVLLYIRLIKESKTKKAREQLQLKLFLKLSRVIMKNISNFFFLAGNARKEYLHTPDDLISECYIIFLKCVKNFDPKRGYNLAFLYNKSLTRGLKRLADKHYNKHGNVYSFPDNYDYGSNDKELNFTLLYMKQCNLTLLERKLVRSKINGEKVDEFRRKNGDISTIHYYDLLKSIKIKLKPLRDDITNFS